MYILIIILIFLILFLIKPCSNSFRTKSGKMYHARDFQTAKLLDVLRNISIDLSNNLNPEDSYLLKKRLQNTSFKELIDINPNILAWNYDKGREIGIKIYTFTGNILPADQIITSLLHELSHSLTKEWGHGKEWKIKEVYIMTFKQKYVEILLNKTFINN
jgi:hypothetical protein